MDAVFSWRRTRACDLPACLALHPAKNGAETVGSAQAMKAWCELFGMTHATRTAVAEMHGKGESKIVGFGFAAFVKKSFAEAEVRNPRPGLNSRIIESVVAGKPVIATFEDVRDANTQGDLQQVILDTSWHNALLSPTQRDEVRVLLGIAYMDLHVGYHFSRILSEMVDELDLWHVRDHRSFQIADRFEAYRLSNPNTTWNADRALLDGNTRLYALRSSFHRGWIVSASSRTPVCVHSRGTTVAGGGTRRYRRCVSSEFPVRQPACDQASLGKYLRTRCLGDAGSLPSREWNEGNPEKAARARLRQESPGGTAAIQLRQT